MTPVEEMPENPYENETVIPRGNGVHETAALTDAAEKLETIREALIAEYGDEYGYEELDSDIAVPEGLTAYYNDPESVKFGSFKKDFGVFPICSHRLTG